MGRKFKTEREEIHQYLSDKKNMKSFINELHNYLRKHMKGCKDNNSPRHPGCAYDRKGPYTFDALKNFILYCHKKRLQWTDVHCFFYDDDMGQRCVCDCDFLYRVFIDENDNMVIKDR